MNENKDLFREGSDVNVYNNQISDYPSLHLAIILQKHEEVSELLKSAVDLNEKSRLSLTPLHYAALVKDIDCMNLLLVAGANVDVKDKDGRTALHFCAFGGFSEGIKLLLSYHADVNATDHVGCVPLHIAAVNGSLTSVQVLIEGKAHFELKEFVGRSVLHEAVRFNHLNIVRYLLMEKRMNTEDRDGYGRTIFDISHGLTSHYLTLYNSCTNNSSVEEMLKQCINQGDQQLFFFSIELLAYFKQSNILLKNADQIWQRLSKRSSHFIVDFCKAILKTNDREFIHRTLDKFLDVQARNNITNTKKNLLHIAAEVNCPMAVELCKDEWILKIDQFDSDSMNPIHVAANLGHLDFITAAIEAYSDPRLLLVEAKSGLNVLALAVKTDRVEILLFLKEKLGNNLDKFYELKKANTTIVHHCSEYGALNTLSELLKDKKIKNLIAHDIVNSDGHTPQHIAAMKGYYKILDRLRVANPNFSVKDKAGNTVLHLAVSYGHLQTVRYLLEVIKVNTRIENFNAKTPYDLAVDKQKLGIRNLLSDENRISYDNTKIDLSVFSEKGRRKKVSTRETIMQTISSMSPTRKITSITFQGGGMKGIAYYGAVRTLIDKEVIDLNNIKRVAGTSAGAITALLLCLGYAVDEFDAEMKKINFEELIEKKHRDLVFALKDGKYNEILGSNLAILSQDLLSSKRNYFEKFTSFVTRFVSACKDAHAFRNSMHGLLQTLDADFGIFKGDTLLSKFEDFIEQKTGNKYLTFGELEEKVKNRDKSNSNQTFKSLYVIGYSLGSAPGIKIFSAEHTPEVVIAHAVRISMSIPFFFKPHRIHIKKVGETKPVPIEGLFVDGGIAKNNPVDIFDDLKYLIEGSKGSYVNPEVIGFKLVSDQSEASTLTHSNSSTAREAESIFHYIQSIAEALMDVENANFYLNEANKSRTLFINTGKVSTVDFDLDEAKQETLITAGKQGANDYITRQSNKQGFDSDLIAVENQVKDELKPHLNISLAVLFSVPLESICSLSLTLYSSKLIYRLMQIKELSLKSFQDLLFHMKLDLTRLDSNENNVAHLFAVTGNLAMLKNIHELKANLLVSKNLAGHSPIEEFYIYYNKSHPKLIKELKYFCRNSEYLILKNEIEEVSARFSGKASTQAEKSANPTMSALSSSMPIFNSRDPEIVPKDISQEKGDNKEHGFNC